MMMRSTNNSNKHDGSNFDNNYIIKKWEQIGICVPMDSLAIDTIETSKN